MPIADELPDDLAPLARRNAFELHDASWSGEVERLITTLDRFLGRAPVERPARDSSVNRVLNLESYSRLTIRAIGLVVLALLLLLLQFI